MSQSAARLFAAFAGSTFSRLQARRAGLEADLSAAEAEGLVRFVRCAGVSGGLPYVAERELFRVLP